MTAFGDQVERPQLASFHLDRTWRRGTGTEWRTEEEDRENSLYAIKGGLAPAAPRADVIEVARVARDSQGKRREVWSGMARTGSDHLLSGEG